MTTEITAADLAAGMSAADTSVEDEIARLQRNARATVLADMFGPHLPAHLPPVRLRCLDDIFGEPRLFAYPVPDHSGGGMASQARTFAAWLVDHGIEDYLVQLSNDEHHATVFTAHLTIAGLPVSLRLFVWPWEMEADAAEAMVAEAVAAVRAEADRTREAVSA
jgi:hypothetical protein